MIYLDTKFHMHISNTSVIIAVNPKAKHKF